MQSLKTLQENHGKNTAIVATSICSTGEAITIVHLDPQADVVGETLTARLKASAALLPFLVHSGFRGLLPKHEPAPSDAAESTTQSAGAEESSPEASSEVTANAEVLIDETDESESQVIFAVFVGSNDQPEHIFLLTEGLIIDGETFGPLLVGLNEEEMSAPSEALIEGLKAAVEWSDDEAGDGYLYLIIAGNEPVEDVLAPFKPSENYTDTTFTIGGEDYSVVSFDV